MEGVVLGAAATDRSEKGMEGIGSGTGTEVVVAATAIMEPVEAGYPQVGGASCVNEMGLILRGIAAGDEKFEEKEGSVFFVRFSIVLSSPLYVVRDNTEPAAWRGASETFCVSVLIIREFVRGT